MFKVQDRLCSTCIYKPDSPLDLNRLEDEVADDYGGFHSYRICHHAGGENVCCRGFWNAHKDEFQIGQIAQRLNVVKFVAVDLLGS